MIFNPYQTEPPFPTSVVQESREDARQVQRIKLDTERCRDRDDLFELERMSLSGHLRAMKVA